MGKISGIDLDFMLCRSDFFMQDSRSRIYMGNEAKKSESSDVMQENPYSGALQRPEENRLHLEAMLRNALKKQKTRKSSLTQWRAFLIGYTGQNANGNDFFE